MPRTQLRWTAALSLMGACAAMAAAHAVASPALRATEPTLTKPSAPPNPPCWRPWTPISKVGTRIRVTAHRRAAFPRRLWWLIDGRRMYWAADRRECRPTNDTPAGAVRQFLISFATQDTAALAGLLTADYRFTSTDPGFTVRFPGGLDRMAQIDSVARLPDGPPNGDPESSNLPTLSLVAVFPDTLIAWSPPPVGRASETIALRMLEIRASSDVAEVWLADSGACSFVLVRGDSALVPPGQPTDARHWYVARWRSEAASARNAGSVDSTAGEAFPTAAQASPPVFGVRRKSAPHGWPITFELSLPDPIDARVDLFDLGGRRVLSRTVANAVPAVRRFQLEVDDLEAGLYWLRVRHGPRQHVTKVVVLR